MWSDIPGWFSFSHVYDKMVAEAADGDTIVEVGVAFGRSLAYLARKAIDSGKRLTIVAVDPWPDDAGWDGAQATEGWGGEYAALAKEAGSPFKAFHAMMGRYAPDELARVTVLRCTSVSAAQLFGAKDRIRGVLIDANHSYDAVRADIEAWKGLVMPGGILAGDDYSPEYQGVIDAVKGTFVEPSHPDNGAFGDGVGGTTWWVRL